MYDFLREFLMYCMPAGMFGSIVTWLINRKLYNARSAKEMHGIYKEMYDDVKVSLEKLNKENGLLYQAVSRLERAVSKVGNCRHVDVCPVRFELRDQKERLRANDFQGACANKRTGNSRGRQSASDDPDEHSAIGITCDEPP